MAGATAFHNLTTTNTVRALGNAAAETPYRVYGSDMKARVTDEIFYYPDVMVMCGPLADTYFETAPRVVIEVLSKSTARRDRFEKRLAYQEVESLQLYLLIDSRKRAIRGYYRTPGGWEERVFGKDDEVSVPCVDATLSLEQLYAKVQL